MSKTETRAEAAFAALHDQIAALRDGAGGSVTAGHRDLGPDLWLSGDPAGRATLACQPGGEGVLLRLEAGDSGAWAALGMRLPVEVLARGRYLGLMIEAASRGAAAFTPVLRYLAEGGLHDVGTPEPVVLAGGRRRHLAWLPIDHDRLAATRACELNLFFHNDGMELDIARLEPLLLV